MSGDANRRPRSTWPCSRAMFVRSPPLPAAGRGASGWPARRSRGSATTSTGPPLRSGFGDPGARILLVGRACGARRQSHGPRLHRRRQRRLPCGRPCVPRLANRPASVLGGDGLEAIDLWVTAPVKCATDNRPPPSERAIAARPTWSRAAAPTPEGRRGPRRGLLEAGPADLCCPGGSRRHVARRRDLVTARRCRSVVGHCSAAIT